MLKHLLKTFMPTIRNLPPVTKTTRKILYETKDISIVSFQWKKGYLLHEHDHHGQCLYQVLDGKLIETRGNRYAGLLTPNNLKMANKGVKHAIMALEDSISIHVYSPPPPRKSD